MNSLQSLSTDVTPVHVRYNTNQYSGSRQERSVMASYRRVTGSMPGSVNVECVGSPLSVPLHQCQYHCTNVSTIATMSVPLHQCYILIFMLILAASEGRTGKSWKPSKIQQCCFDIAALDTPAAHNNAVISQHWTLQLHTTLLQSVSYPIT